MSLASLNVTLTEKNVAEKRREIRRPAQGCVTIAWSNPRPMAVFGRLVDVSDSGFRMAHDCTSLVSGQIVTFDHEEARGNARVVWSRILGEGVESGFVLVR